MNVSLKYICIEGFAEEFDEIIYEGVSNWIISFRSLFALYSSHFSYLLLFFVILGCGFLSFKHSLENGHKHSLFWYGALVYGVITERAFTSNKFWHAQAPIMFFGKQLPLHIVLLYPSVIYLAMITVQRLRINIWAEPLAVGLLVMLTEIPHKVISVKFLHITYHDSEPLYYYKLCGVPWIELFSSLVGASTYVALYHGALYYQSRDVSVIWDQERITRAEVLTAILCGVGGPIGGFLQKIIFFHIPYDFFNVNPVSCLLFTVSLYLLLVINFEPSYPRDEIDDTKGKTYLFYQLLVYLIFFLYLAVFGTPQNEISIGRHEPVGDCTTLIWSRTPLGKPVKRKKFLCADEVAARKNYLYHFDCLEEGPPCSSAIWYTICGAPIYNRVQFFMNVLSLAIMVLSIFTKILFSDVKKIEVAKHLVVRFQKMIPQEEEAEIPHSQKNARDEVTVGFVLTQNDVRQLPKGFQLSKKKAQ